MWNFIVYLNDHLGSCPEDIAKVAEGQEENYDRSFNTSCPLSANELNF
jgi:hypothetical protein